MVEQAVLSLLETTINQVLSMDPDSNKRLAILTGKVVAVEISDWQKTLYFSFSETGVTALAAYEGEPTTQLQGKLKHLFGLARSKQATTEILSGNITISGDTETGQAVKALFDELDIDWQAQLAKYTGEQVAEKTTSLFRKVVGWSQTTVNNMVSTSKEYLAEEIDIMPTEQEAEVFYADVDALREAVARLQARVDELSRDS